MYDPDAKANLENETRSSDLEPITEESLAAARDEVALSWERAYADPTTVWYRLAVGLLS